MIPLYSQQHFQDEHHPRDDYQPSSDFAVESELLIFTEEMTLIIKDLPNVLRQNELLLEVRRCGFDGFFNLLYLPRRMKSRNEGYAFLNFTCVVAAHAFMKAWHRQERFQNLSNGPHILCVRRSTSQGLQANIDRWVARHRVRPYERDKPPFVVGVKLIVSRQRQQVSQGTHLDASSLASVAVNWSSLQLPVGEDAAESHDDEFLPMTSQQSSQVSIVPTRVRSVRLNTVQNDQGALVWSF